MVELSLNNIGAAANVVHYVAENEHRENFSLTNTHVGVTKVFPGVHSDIGGSYNDGLEIVEEIETSKLSKNKLNPLIESPIPAEIMADSHIGVFRTRSFPNCSTNPSVILNTPPYSATS